MIDLCNQYRARPACTNVQSDQALYCWLTTSNSNHDDVQFQKMIIPFKKFSRLRLNEKLVRQYIPTPVSTGISPLDSSIVSSG